MLHGNIGEEEQNEDEGSQRFTDADPMMWSTRAGNITQTININKGQKQQMVTSNT